MNVNLNLGLGLGVAVKAIVDGMFKALTSMVRSIGTQPGGGSHGRGRTGASTSVGTKGVTLGGSPGRAPKAKKKSGDQGSFNRFQASPGCGVGEGGSVPGADGGPVPTVTPHPDVDDQADDQASDPYAHRPWARPSWIGDDRDMPVNNSAPIFAAGQIEQIHSARDAHRAEKARRAHLERRAAASAEETREIEATSRRAQRAAKDRYDDAVTWDTVRGALKPDGDQQ
jgi:hypothetical protein